MLLQLLHLLRPHSAHPLSTRHSPQYTSQYLRVLTTSTRHSLRHTNFQYHGTLLSLGSTTPACECVWSDLLLPVLEVFEHDGQYVLGHLCTPPPPPFARVSLDVKRQRQCRRILQQYRRKWLSCQHDWHHCQHKQPQYQQKQQKDRDTQPPCQHNQQQRKRKKQERKREEARRAGSCSTL